MTATALITTPVDIWTPTPNDAPSVPLPRAHRLAARRTQRLFVVLLLVAFAPVIAPRTAQPASRYALTAAIVDHGTIDIGRYGSILGIDRAVYDGHVRSDKGPLQPILAAPFYAVARALGAPPAERAPATGDLTLWWLTVCTSLVPFVALWALVLRAARRVAPRTALVSTLALAGATIALPHAVNLYGHSLSALFGFAAYECARRRDGAWTSSMAAGLCAGAAIATEYHLVIVAAVVAVLVARRGLRSVCVAALGAVPPLALLGWYQWRAFGAPWHTPFAYYAGSLGGTTRGGWSVPAVHDVAAALFGSRGLLLTSPVVLIGIVAAVVVAIRGTDVSTRVPSNVDIATAVFVTTAYLVLVAGWSGTRWLEEPGPRYLIPALPFLAIPLALAWSHVPRLARVAAVWGGAMMVAASTTFLLVAGGNTPLQVYTWRVVHARFLPTLWTRALGSYGAYLHVVTTAFVVVALVRAARAPGVRESHV